MDKAKDEKRIIINKGRRWFMSYLSKVMDGSMSEKNRNQLMSVICSLYLKEIKTNDEFFSRVEEFCCQRRKTDEKDLFFREMMNCFMEDDRLKAAYARRYPDEYRHVNKHI